MSKQSRRGFFSRLGLGAAAAALVAVSEPEPRKPESIPVKIRKDGMLVDADGKELNFAIVTKERNPDQYEPPKEEPRGRDEFIIGYPKGPPRPAELTFMPDTRTITCKDEEQG